jgi:hypothetical protein
MWFENVFSILYVAFSFYFVSFAVQKPFPFSSTACLFLLLLPVLWGLYLKESLSWQMSWSLSPIFSSMIFTILVLMFKSLIYLSWFLCIVSDKGPVSFLCVWTLSFEDRLFFTVHFGTLFKISWLYIWICCIGLYACFYASTILFWLP